jgi:hypothetical protein
VEMLDRHCPRVVETREPATETTLEDVLARNLSIRSTARRGLLGFLPPRVASAHSTRQYFAFEGVARLLYHPATGLLP